ncbi:AraC family transcriptional regulator [Faecalicatena contorta]|uniref:AraC family transcriptional regulator n=1 Tax=Faecalicatena contorta TaxID=39482 RepID=UPI00337A87E1
MLEGTYKYSYKAGENLLTSLSVYNVGHQKCGPGYQWGPGVRNHYCIHHIISGSGFYSVNGSTSRLAEGDTFILYPDTEVRYYADREDPWEYAWVGFMGTDAAPIIRATDFTKEKPFIENGGPPRKILQGQLSRIYEVKGNSHEAAVAMTGALYTLLSTFMHYSGNRESARDIQLSYVEKAKAYISTSYSYPITVEDVASYVGISRSHLYRSFQACQQQSPKEYLSSFRVKQACLLLKETSLSIAAIAYSVGFENNLYFSKAFKKQMLVSPTEYRRG